MMSQEVLQVVHEKEPHRWSEEATITLRQHEGGGVEWPSIDEDLPTLLEKKGRRKSWHAVRFERKRRKGVVEGASPEGSPGGTGRQKRPSWWNLFVNQPWPRYAGRGISGRGLLVGGMWVGHEGAGLWGRVGV
ncbi:unnamed protein product [Phaedon cochleariae]|uniref:Uncharacterized protein n=1 Tax=Phaedon cochleariae TaxID=80249 RepID=A0A9N9SCA7_PHACE|nr:unnamed protein product [Phaedon cochleariae]